MFFQYLLLPVVTFITLSCFFLQVKELLHLYLYILYLGANSSWFNTFDVEICFAKHKVTLFHLSNFLEFCAFDL